VLKKQSLWINQNEWWMDEFRYKYKEGKNWRIRLLSEVETESWPWTTNPRSFTTDLHFGSETVQQVTLKYSLGRFLFGFCSLDLTHTSASSRPSYSYILFDIFSFALEQIWFWHWSNFEESMFITTENLLMWIAFSQRNAELIGSINVAIYNH